MAWRDNESNMYDEVTFDAVAKMYEQAATPTTSLHRNHQNISAEATSICDRLGIKANVDDVKHDSVSTYIYFDGYITGDQRKKLENELKERFGSNCQVVAFHY